MEHDGFRALNKPGKCNISTQAVKRSLVTETAAAKGGTSSIHRICFNYSWDKSQPQCWCARPWKQKLQLQYLMYTVRTTKCKHTKTEWIFGPPWRKKTYIVWPFFISKHQTRDQETVSQLVIFINQKTKSLQIFRKTFIKSPWLHQSTQACGIYKNPHYPCLWQYYLCLKFGNNSKFTYPDSTERLFS